MTKKTNKDYLFVGIQLFLFAAYTLDLIIIKIDVHEYLIYMATINLALAILLGFLAVLQLNKNLSPFPTPKTESNLITNGVFAIARHPIYTSIILAAVAYGVIQESIFKILMALLLWALFYFKSSYEEFLLEKAFPEYKLYQSKVGRFFPKLFNRIL